MKLYKKDKINTIRYDYFNRLTGIQDQYNTLKDDIDKFTYTRGYQFERYTDVEYVTRMYIDFADIKINRGETVVEDNSARAFGTPEETANQIRDDLQNFGIDYTQPLGIVLVTDKETLADKELSDSYTRILGQEKLGFTGWVFDVIFISENVTKSLREKLKTELAQMLNRHPPRTEQSIHDVTQTVSDAFKGEKPTKAEIQEKTLRMTSVSKEPEITAAVYQSTGQKDSYTFWTNQNKRKGFNNNLKEKHGIEPFTEKGEYDKSRNMGGHVMLDKNVNRTLISIIDSWKKNNTKSDYEGEYFVSHYGRPTENENFDEKEDNVHNTMLGYIKNAISFFDHIRKTGEIPITHLYRYPQSNEKDILTKPVEVKKKKFNL